ncbi:hypothetical protein CRYUN_Cryun37aG0078800 [Craigia yunnanensis]
MALSTMIHNHLPTTLNTGVNRISAILPHQEVVYDHPKTNKTSNGRGARGLAESLSNLLHLHIEPHSSRKNFQHSNWDLFDEEKQSTPTTYPNELVADKWRDIHGSMDWKYLLDPLHPWLRREIIKYGEFARATYDAFDFDSFSEYCGSCRYNRNKLFEKLGLSKNGYNVTKYIYAMSHIEMPPWQERSHLMDTWSKYSNWMGYVAVSNDEETRQEVSLTITGHSLGGALALLNAYEAAANLPCLPVSVISFGAPRVGNSAFRSELDELEVKTLRAVVKQDLVPRMPGIVFNESLQTFDDITGTLKWVYTHIGAELRLNVNSSPYLKRGFNPLGFHSLETYLHLVDGFLSADSIFLSDARRDVTLVNKACDILVDELRIPHCWYQLANKGLVCNGHGRWVKPRRDPEDIPSPIGDQAHEHYQMLYAS